MGIEKAIGFMSFAVFALDNSWVLWCTTHVNGYRKHRDKRIVCARHRVYRIQGAVSIYSGNEQTSMTLNGGTPETRTYDAWGRLATRVQGRKNFTTKGTEDTEKEKIMARGVGADVTVHRYGAGWDPVVNESGSGTVLGAWVMTRGARGKKLAYVTGGLQGAQGRKNFTTEGTKDTEKEKIMARGVGADVTVHRYGAGWDPVVNENGSGTVLGAWVMTPGARGKKLAYIAGGLQGTSPMYTYSDHLGSIRRARLQDVSSVGSDEFEPYGGVYASTGSLSALKLRHFAMHLEDTALQGYRAPYRVYSPAMARWTREDPLEMADGPNTYAYVRNAPLIKRDLLGLLSILDIVDYIPWLGPCKAGAKVIADSINKHFGDNYMRHCVGQCLLTQSYGDKCAKLAGYYHEFLDKNSNSYNDPWGNAGDTINDLINNNVGRSCGNSCGENNCISCCQSNRSHGSFLSSNVW